ncbi:signal peptidase II [Heliophilum fasciatum]|uniref:Lipoprotein signal peptidase n=1 Tax=Heliophilum fasciatum TaxID=35700 RepID=A0A4R2RXB3_9FIRM|nr:signal peptidase II [Heliophilum fasciatum]MCW2277231.1 signal peptidase II [Heliophilum fasciatum]TCP68134.1 signal peptidase II [Heliophilum fasciatum]
MKLPRVTGSVFAGTALTVLALDRWSKYLVQSRMAEHESIPLWPDVFHLTYILNPGAAFGIFAHQRWLFIGITVLVLLGILLAAWKLTDDHVLLRLGLALQAGGAVGNFIDRVQSGLVIDFLDFRIWPIFNIADIAITVGVALLIIGILMMPDEERDNRPNQECGNDDPKRENQQAIQ